MPDPQPPIDPPEPVRLDPPYYGPETAAEYWDEHDAERRALESDHAD